MHSQNASGYFTKALISNLVPSISDTLLGQFFSSNLLRGSAKFLATLDHCTDATFLVLKKPGQCW